MLNYGYGWDLLDKLDDHRHCKKGDMFLICHMTACDMFKGLCYLMGGSLSC